MILFVILLGFVVGYLSVFVALATIQVIDVRINGVCEPFRTKRTFVDAFLDIFCHPYVKFSLTGNRKLVFGIKHYNARNNTSNSRNKKTTKNIHNNMVSGNK